MISADSLKSIAALFDNRRRQLASDLERRRARSQELPHPRSSYTGSFAHPNWGTIAVELRDSALVFRMGVASAVAEVYDAAKNQLRAELLGSADIVSMIMDGDRAIALEISGVRFNRIR